MCYVQYRFVRTCSQVHMHNTRSTCLTLAVGEDANQDELIDDIGCESLECGQIG